MAGAAGPCGQPGQFLAPPASLPGSAPTPLVPGQLLQQLARKQVVLLGERHDYADDHRWQLMMLTALQQIHPKLAIGFEMFPRRMQPVLDRWVAGQLSEAEFLQQTEWDKVWKLDPQLYLPLFRFARQYRLPMLALNVEHELVTEVRNTGLDAVPETRREGVGRPAAPSSAYLEALQAIFDAHPAMQDSKTSRPAPFAHFVEAQTLWDRAMAEGIARFLQGHPEILVVGVLGAGHVRNGYGVPHQLRDLGVSAVANLLTVPSDHDCAEIVPSLADAVFLIPPQPEQDAALPPRLGVSLAEAKEGIRIEKVMPGSLAQRSGLLEGDVIVQAAASKVRTIEEVRSHVYRQPAGTWLPLLIRRGNDSLEIVVRFPPEAEAATVPRPH
ncbi:MAG: PDZ domain-containing protein [Thiobacillus sp.]|nr:PDZ domain-containing protein [Thiobacillus sp.]